MKLKIGIFFTLLSLFISSNASELKTEKVRYKYTRVKQDRFYEDELHRENNFYNSATPSTNPNFVDYKVRDHQTLMLIAYELYSDFKKWRLIAKDNELTGSESLRKGLTLKIRKPLNPRVYPKGLPYIIRHKDTLGKISKKVYGKSRFWESIYSNNRDQIHHPDLIFAGFTLFYTKKPLIFKRHLATSQ